jgi:hypothetical protein
MSHVLVRMMENSRAFLGRTPVNGAMMRQNGPKSVEVDAKVDVQNYLFLIAELVRCSCH